MSKLINTLLVNDLPLGSNDMEQMLKGIYECNLACDRNIEVSAITRCLKHYMAERPLTETMQKHLRMIEMKIQMHSRAAIRTRRVFWIAEILGERKACVLDDEDAWGAKALSDIEELSNDLRQDWERLIRFAGMADKSKPTKKWLAEAAKYTEAVGEAEFQEKVQNWLREAKTPTKAGTPTEQVEQKREVIEGMDDEEYKKQVLELVKDGGLPFLDVLSDQVVERITSMSGAELKQWGLLGLQLVEECPVGFTERNSDVLKGLLWCSSLYDHESLNRVIGDLAEVCFRKVPGLGPMSTKIGNACVYALAAIASPSAVSQLSRLKQKVKYVSAQKMIRSALREAAHKAGMTEAELEESAVMWFGLDCEGILREALGTLTAEVRIAEGSKVELRWIRENGKTGKTVPAAVKAGYAERLKELKQTANDITKELSSQRSRLERLFLSRRSWKYGVWRERYLDHPVVGALARRLIWWFGDVEARASGVCLGGQIVGVNGRPLEGLTAEMNVSLWHPVEASVEEVRSWRTFLLEHQVCQPFKQAHREVYLLTDAERQTEVYSNRFAAHILKQHQFTSLCQQRGWRYTLQGMWDSHNTPTIHLPQWDLWAEFWVDALENDQTGGTGVFLYLSTDQVRFYGLQRQPVALCDLPALVFSEVMRDIDLFVGVASVGNDPSWNDGGPEGRYRDYWNSYSFGELSGAAQMRGEVLAGLLPRLKIAGRCSIEGKFLRVRGDIRTYKIHLGSGNILMEPNDEYLCIVAGRGTGRDADKLFLPFEGDGTLSMILSKAFLLAEDTKIKDATIVGQIKRGV